MAENQMSGSLASERTAHPITDQPVFEILAL